MTTPTTQRRGNHGKTHVVYFVSCIIMKSNEIIPGTLSNTIDQNDATTYNRTRSLLLQTPQTYSPTFYSFTCCSVCQTIYPEALIWKVLHYKTLFLPSTTYSGPRYMACIRSTSYYIYIKIPESR